MSCQNKSHSITETSNSVAIIPDMICYCFGWTKTAITNEIVQTGTTRALHDIRHKMKVRGCSCSTLNPSGKCCLPEVKLWIAQTKEEAMSITIYHNPKCGTSRNTLAMIRASGEEPIIIEYLNTPPSKTLLNSMIESAGLSVREAMRTNVPEYADNALDNPELSDDELLTAMITHPILINRPFVITPKGTRLCRPSELILDILPNPHLGTFTKEDGEVIVCP